MTALRAFNPAPRPWGAPPRLAFDATGGHLDLREPVSALLRKVAASIVMPRFRALAISEISEKTPGEVVTIADREAEARLADGLAALGTGARIVGEEACEAEPSLLDDLDSGATWLIDPIDGTANFAAGRAPFGMMIALAIDGLTEAAWLFDPLSGRMCFAARGRGAHIDGERVVVHAPARHRPVAALATQFMTPEARQSAERRAADMFDLVPIPRCAAEHYPRVCLGENDVGLFQRTLPWDHAPGVLFLEEAGGRAARWDGSEYRIGDTGRGLLIANDGALWDRAAAALGCADAGFTGS